LFYCFDLAAVETNLPSLITSYQAKVSTEISLDNNEILDAFFEGGSEAYFDIIRKNMRYPMNSSKNKVQGSLIFSIKVSPTTGIHLDFLTKLDINIEKAVKNVISKTEGLWNTEEEYTLYQTIFFSIGEEYNSKFEEKVSSFKKNYEGQWLEPSPLSIRGTTPKEQLGDGTDFNKMNNRSVGNKLGRKSSEVVVYDIDPYSEYKSALSKYKKAFKKGKSESAYEKISQAILFNPFDLESIETRQKLALELGETDFEKYDQLLLEALKK